MIDEKRVWIIYDRETNDLVRIVEGPESLVMMSGVWASSYQYTEFAELLRLARLGLKHEALQNIANASREAMLHDLQKAAELPK